MSGTSIDGIDAVLATFVDGHFDRLAATHTHAYPDALRSRLLDVSLKQPALSFREFCELDVAVGEAFAAAANALLSRPGVDRERIRAIGSHGQTLFHDGAAQPPLTLQLGDPNRIVALTGITTVADFRRRDQALAGQGAPLLPIFHHARFARRDEPRAVINIGGIANVTLLPDDRAEQVRGFDTGPGNGLMNEWAELSLQQSCDLDGRQAASGAVDAALLARLLSDPYFALPPPKSTGRDRFHLDWAGQQGGFDGLDPATVQSTLCELTVRTIADALLREAPATRRVLVCGGGACNPELMRRLGVGLPGLLIETTDAHGLPSEWIEATAFAWLAMRTLSGLQGNLPAVTGALATAPLGGIYPA
jgi:anhydro-N-acetylmuramic acid kinase